MNAKVMPSYKRGKKRSRAEILAAEEEEMVAVKPNSGKNSQ
jgi:hypothetical protein